ncbi:cupin domain-containing protein [Pengzhenrongella sicca]|uniref:Cupin n=1 Tax=Pengzhenrongella sicca TaxID=2819238 RepID=A0A8A4ZAE7_9MICO|nr:cupin [Pengzhenrongella sicca]QTE27863.1 cupin [Pengzhenrongella sicca]
MLELPALADTYLAAARASDRGRSAEVVVHDGELRQTIIALTAGSELREHNAPPAASLQVLRGRVRVTDEKSGVEVPAGGLYLLTHHRHAVVALTDAVFLLTTVTSVPS